MAKAVDYTKTNKKELITEHKRLIAVLNSDSHEDDKKEAKIQLKELKELLSKKDVSKGDDSFKLVKKEIYIDGKRRVLWVNTKLNN